MVKQPKNKKTIIFSAVLIFAIHALISIILYSKNFPISDDWPSVFLTLYYQAGDPWFTYAFNPVNEGFPIFRNAVMIFGYLLNSFNVQQFMYLNWGFLSASVIIFYTILKKTDERLIWIIIPIAAFVFSPKMVSTNFTASIGLVWIGTFFFLVVVIGIFSKQNLSKFWFSTAIIVSVIATFTSALGMLAFLVGIFYLIKKNNEKKIELIIWVIVSIIVISFYILNAGEEVGRPSINEVTSTSGVIWALEYVSNPFSVKLVELRILIGSISIISIVSISLFLLKKNRDKAIPWIVFGVVGILSTIATDVGRFGLREPSTNYFIIISNFTQISLIAIASILFLEIQGYKGRGGKTIKLILICIITSQIILLTTSYYSGSNYILEWDDEKTKWLSCFDLPTNLEFCKKWNVFGDPYMNRSDLENILPVYNNLIEKKLSIFSEKEFFINQEQKKKEIEMEWNTFEEGIGIGDIKIINGHNVNENKKHFLNNSSINISGWIMSNNEKIDGIYLFIDKKIFLKVNNKISDIIENTDNSIEWNTVFFSGFLENGCHDLQIGGIVNNTKFIIDKKIIICKE